MSDFISSFGSHWSHYFGRVLALLLLVEERCKIFPTVVKNSAVLTVPELVAKTVAVENSKMLQLFRDTTIQNHLIQKSYLESFVMKFTPINLLGTLNFNTGAICITNYPIFKEAVASLICGAVFQPSDIASSLHE